MTAEIIYGVDFKAKFGPVLSPAEIEASWNAPFEVIPVGSRADTAPSEYLAPDGDCA
jgi:hypothetical protein